MQEDVLRVPIGFFDSRTAFLAGPVVVALFLRAWAWSERHEADVVSVEVVRYLTAELGRHVAVLDKEPTAADLDDLGAFLYMHGDLPSDFNWTDHLTHAGLFEPVAGGWRVVRPWEQSAPTVTQAETRPGESVGRQLTLAARNGAEAHAAEVAA